MQTPHHLNNRYEILRELGDGGFGKTFLVRDHQMPSSRQCVLKQLKPLQGNPEIYTLVKERFQREAAILEHLGDHPQVPRLHAYFCENDLFYLVEEYIEGDTLTQLIQRQGPQSETFVRQILTQILPALAHIHQQKIVHRDIKPDNIILRSIDQTPVLIDFGAVKETMATILNSQGNSARSIVVGTPGYMPSEQMIGRPVYASDLYSLGLTAIYLLTAKLPQDLDTDPATGAYLWRNHTTVTPQCATLLDRAIQLTPANRFSTAQEMLTSLNNLTNGASDMTIPPSAPKYISEPISAPPASTLPTYAAIPQIPTPMPNQNPNQNQPAQISQNSGSDWKKAAIIGSIIGMSVLGGAVLLKSQTNQPTPVASISPTPTTSPTASPTVAPTAVSQSATAPTAPEPKRPDRTAAEVAKDEAGSDATIVGDSGSKNVRSGPGTQYDSPHVAYPGDRIKILATSRGEGGFNWHKVYFPKSGAEGWIAAQLVQADERGETEPVETPEPNPEPKPTNNDITNATIIGDSGSKNIRSGPGVSYDSPHMAYPGDRIQIIDSTQDKGGFTWYKVSFPKSGAEGWIAAQLVKQD